MLSKLFSSKDQTLSIKWNILSSIEGLEKLEEASNEKPAVIFKHSTRCSISLMALDRFERAYTDDANFEPYYLDLIVYPEISNQIANKYEIRHESPQALLMVGGKIIYASSHSGINFNEINGLAENKA